MSKILFIGGDADGQMLDVPDDLETCRLPRPDKMDVHIDADIVQLKEPHIYIRKIRVSPKTGEHHVFLLKELDHLSLKWNDG